MAVFFNGQLHITPAVMSLVDDRAMRNKNLSVGNVLAIIGQSEGGEPNKELRFGSPSEARATLRSGELLTAIEKAFDPSSQTNGASTIIGIRVNPALQSALTLKDGAAANVISLKSTDYGLYTNQIKLKVEAGTNKGKKLTTQFGNDFYTQDDVYREAFSIQYTGAQATSVMNITNTQITLEAPAATTVATIDLNIYDTVQKVVDFINTVTDFTGIVLDGNNTKPTLNGLDAVAAQDVKTAVHNTLANLQAVVDWINGFGEGFVTATREATGDAVPADIAFTYLTGGSDGTVTNNEWSNAFTTLQASDTQWVVPVSSDPSIHAMADTHCTFMSNQGKMERRCLVGGALAESQATVIAAAKALNSDRTSIVYPGFYDFNDNGDRTLYAPYVMAAMIAGGFAGSNPGTPLTNKTIKIRGVETELRNPTDTDVLIEDGVMVVRETPKGFKVVKSISTWLVNDNYNRVEVSTGFATDFVARNVREVLEDLIGEKASPLILKEAVNRAESTLYELAREEPAGPGVIVGDQTNPAYKNIIASIDGDVLRVEFQCSPVIPVNYIPVTIHAVPYSGTSKSL